MQLPPHIHHIHMIAICGTGMGSLAGLLVDQGYQVTGSDQNVYPPMSTELAQRGIQIFSGYQAANLKAKPDLVIVGNAVSKDNPEVVEMLARELPYLSMPQAVSEFLIQDKKSIVVAGTHGKTTTSTLLAHLLTELGQDPSYLVGGIPIGEMKNCREGRGDYFVVEGDEYDTAFFDKGPKFLHYKSYYSLITSLEFDHADIYDDVAHIQKSFKALLHKNNPDGFVLACCHYPYLIELLKESQARCETYGHSDNADWYMNNQKFNAQGCQFDIFYKNSKEQTIRSPLPGDHNALNLLACFALLRHLGFGASDIADAALSFKGIKRRQELKGIVKDIHIFDDFAHHPTAVSETISALKKRYADYPLWAVFEPRSNTSKSDIFQNEYAHAFQDADKTIIADVFMPEKAKDGRPLDVERLVGELQSQGLDAEHLSGVDSIVDCIKQQAPSPSVVLIMSNGAFGGIHQKLLDQLA